VNSNPTYAAPVYAPPPAASAEPLPGAAAPLPPRPVPQPLPSLVEMSPRAKRKAAARVAAQTESTGWIDISAPLSIGVTPTYPGNAPLAMRFDSDMERGAPLDLSEFSMSNHTGTHVDAPLHFLRGAPAIEQIPLEQLCGPVLVLNVDPGVTAITAADLERYPWRGARRILFRTRNSVNEWIVDPQFHSDYTYLAPDAAELLVNSGVVLVGIDYLSIEQFGAPPRTHVILMSKGIAIVEGLDLRQVAAGDYDLTLLPLKILGHEAAPARAVLRRR
jgi:arylformamidase